MVDVNKHKFLLVQILKDIYKDIELANYLGFKGGSALMFFYDLPRFSVDLDFNLLDTGKGELVYGKVRNILLKYGTVFDEAVKFYGLLLVLDYGYGERKLKVEISRRVFEDRYEVKDLLGINVRVMLKEDMFAHKLCALLDRSAITHRDLFDCWFFLQSQTTVNKQIVESRMGMPITDYLQKCIELLEGMSDKGLLHGLGELMDEEMKRFVRTELRTELIGLLKIFARLSSPLSGMTH